VSIGVVALQSSNGGKSSRAADIPLWAAVCSQSDRINLVVHMLRTWWAIGQQAPEMRRETRDLKPLSDVPAQQLRTRAGPVPRRCSAHETGTWWITAMKATTASASIRGLSVINSKVGSWSTRWQSADSAPDCRRTAAGIAFAPLNTLGRSTGISRPLLVRLRG
jgi:hypothetical protein